MLLSSFHLMTELVLICFSVQGFPAEFAMYINYTKGLRFEESPDYMYLRQLFRILFGTLNHRYDYTFDWTMLKQKMLPGGHTVPQTTLTQGQQGAGTWYKPSNFFPSLLSKSNPRFLQEGKVGSAIFKNFPLREYVSTLASLTGWNWLYRKVAFPSKFKFL